MSKMKLYGEITKAEAQDDGTLIVSGVASSEVTDAQGEKITADAMKAAIPDYMKFGAVREMHDSQKAAGTAVSINVNDAGQTEFTAHVVDPVAVKKVQTGVYKGFSIGGKVLKRDDLQKNTITGLRLTEISLVDRPCNPEATLSCFKVDNDDESNEVDAGADDQTPGVVESSAPDVPQVDKVEVVEEVPVVDANTVEKGVALPEGVYEVKLGDKPVTLRKRDDGAFEIVPDEEEEIQKGCYNIGRLAELASNLEYFANSVQWDADNGEAPMEMPKELRSLASSLLDQLILLVGAEVTAAKARLKEASKAKKSAEVDDLRKRLDETNAFKDAVDSITKAFGIPADTALGEIVADLNKVYSDLHKQYTDVKTNYDALLKKAAPSNVVLKAVGKGQDIGEGEVVAKVADEEEVKDPIEAMKKVHSNGGQRLQH